MYMLIARVCLTALGLPKSALKLMLLKLMLFFFSAFLCCYLILLDEMSFVCLQSLQGHTSKGGART